MQRLMQFQLFENSQVQINFQLNANNPMITYQQYNNEKNSRKEVPEDPSWSHFFAFEKTFSKFPYSSPFVYP